MSSQTRWACGSPWACVALLVGLLLAGIPVVASAAPAVTLDPASGPCTTMVTVRGSGFTPGVRIRFNLRRDRDGAITAGNSLGGGGPAGNDGSYTITLPLYGCFSDEPVGSTFTVTLFESPISGGIGPEASAKFTVAAPGLPNTGGGGGATPAPAPTPIALLALGLLGAGGAAWRRAAAKQRAR